MTHWTRVDEYGSTEEGWGREKLNNLLVVVANVPLAPWMEGTLKRFAAAELDREQAESASGSAARAKDGADADSVSRVRLKGAVRASASALRNPNPKPNPNPNPNPSLLWATAGLAGGAGVVIGAAEARHRRHPPRIHRIRG